MSFWDLVYYYDKFDSMVNAIPDAINYMIIMPDHFNKYVELYENFMNDLYNENIQLPRVSMRTVILPEHAYLLYDIVSDICYRMRDTIQYSILGDQLYYYWDNVFIYFDIELIFNEAIGYVNSFYRGGDEGGGL